MAFRRNCKVVVLDRDGRVIGDKPAWRVKFRMAMLKAFVTAVYILKEIVKSLRNTWVDWAKPKHISDEEYRLECFKETRNQIAGAIAFFAACLIGGWPKLLLITAGVEALAIIAENMARRDAMMKDDQTLWAESFKVSGGIIRGFVGMVFVLTVIAWLIVDGTINISEYIPSLKQLSQLQLDLVNEAIEFIVNVFKK